ncbi:hypothetical protein IMZ48_35750 [Candidatus Bathyarchaeota archaeon]|nr:hypothetical protein [Candidatus Bathyarchaeota archaeon]
MYDPLVCLVTSIADSAKMFSILNEVSDYSPGNVVAIVGSSIGSASSIYIIVAITGYLTFGNEVTGNIVSMCKSEPACSFKYGFANPM